MKKKINYVELEVILFFLSGISYLRLKEERGNYIIHFYIADISELRVFVLFIAIIQSGRYKNMRILSCVCRNNVGRLFRKTQSINFFFVKLMAFIICPSYVFDFRNINSPVPLKFRRHFFHPEAVNISIKENTGHSLSDSQGHPFLGHEIQERCPTAVGVANYTFISFLQFQKESFAN